MPEPDGATVGPSRRRPPRHDRYPRIVTGFRWIRKGIRAGNPVTVGRARLDLPTDGWRARPVRSCARRDALPEPNARGPSHGPAAAGHGGSTMTSSIVAVTLALAMNSTGGLF